VAHVLVQFVFVQETYLSVHAQANWILRMKSKREILSFTVVRSVEWNSWNRSFKRGLINPDAETVN
jgi:hypothetical protein